MASILRPGYLRWDGLKYVLDEDIEIVGPPGPPGPPGSGGGETSPDAVIFDGTTSPENIRSDRATTQSPIDNTKIGIVNLGSDVSSVTTGITGDYSTITGGNQNQISGTNSFIGTGSANTISSNFCFIGTGNNLQIVGDNNTILNGTNNFINGGHDNAILSGSGDAVQDNGGFPNWSAVVSGRDNSLSGLGDFNVVIGGEDSHVAASSYSAAGGHGTTVNGGNSSFAFGQNVFVNNSWGAGVGGVENFINGIASAILAGSNNTSSGDNSAVIGGDQCTASGFASIVLAGEQSTATADHGVAIGRRANAPHYAQLSHSGVGSFFGFGSVSQFSRYFVRNQSVNATPIILSDGAGAELTLSTGSAYAIRATCVANRVSTGARAMFVHTLLVHNSGGSVVIDNDNLTLSVPNGQDWTIVFTANGNALRATFTGDTSQTINVMVTYEWSEVGGGA